MTILSYISNDFNRFYIIAFRRRCCENAIHATDLLRQKQFKAAHVHETTLCVASGVLFLGTHFRVFIRCAKYTMICMVWRTCVSQTTLCVAFGARRHWVPLSYLGGLLASGPPRPAKNSGPVLADGGLGCRGRPDMPSGLCFRGPPVGYPP